MSEGEGEERRLIDLLASLQVKRKETILEIGWKKVLSYPVLFVIRHLSLGEYATAKLGETFCTCSIAFNQAVCLRFVNLLAVCELTLYKDKRTARERRAPCSLAILFQAQANGLVERAPGGWSGRAAKATLVMRLRCISIKGFDRPRPPPPS